MEVLSEDAQPRLSPKLFYRLGFENDSEYGWGVLNDIDGHPLCSYQTGQIEGDTIQVTVYTWNPDQAGVTPQQRQSERFGVYIDGRFFRDSAVFRIGADEFRSRTQALRPLPGVFQRWGTSFVDGEGRPVSIVGQGVTPSELHFVSTRGDHYPSGRRNHAIE